MRNRGGTLTLDARIDNRAFLSSRFNFPDGSSAQKAAFRASGDRFIPVCAESASVAFLTARSSAFKVTTGLCLLVCLVEFVFAGVQGLKYDDVLPSVFFYTPFIKTATMVRGDP